LKKKPRRKNEIRSSKIECSKSMIEREKISRNSSSKILIKMKKNLIEKKRMVKLDLICFTLKGKRTGEPSS